VSPNTAGASCAAIGRFGRPATRYFGDITIVICRPSMRGICSTLAIS
jgi:hypothetical protein